MPTPLVSPPTCLMARALDSSNTISIIGILVALIFGLPAAIISFIGVWKLWQEHTRRKVDTFLLCLITAPIAKYCLMPLNYQKTAKDIESWAPRSNGFAPPLLNGHIVQQSYHFYNHPIPAISHLRGRLHEAEDLEQVHVVGRKALVDSGGLLAMPKRARTWSG